MPFYVGWDEQLRKLVITNRISPNYCAGECMKFPGAWNRPFSFVEDENTGTRKIEQDESISQNYSNEYLTLNKLIKKNKTINFTAWPIPRLHQPEIKNPTSYNLLFGSLTDVENNLKFQNLIQNDPNLKKFINGDPGLMRAYGELSSVPINILANGERGNERIAAGELKDIIPYTRGGFIWPGHSDLKFKFKENVSS